MKNYSMEASKILYLDKIKTFESLLETKGITSTGAEVVSYSGILYNVQGSTHDPKEVDGYESLSWKALLIEKGINGNCYVTSPVGNGSHPNFSVGGHMTPNSNGSVSDGITYLIPLCYWHNSTKRNGVPFSHIETTILKLTGYNLGELEATFKMRLPSEMPYSVLFYENENWDFINISTQEAEKIKNEGFEDKYFILVERQKKQSFTESQKMKSEKKVEVLFKLVSSNVPIK